MKGERILAFTATGLIILSGAVFAQTNINPFQTPSSPSTVQPSPVVPPVAIPPAIPVSDQPVTSLSDYYFEQDVTSEYKVGMGETVTKTIHQKMELKDGQMLRVDDPEENAISIVRLDRRAVYQLNTSKKTYFESNFQALKMKLSQDEIRANQVDPQRKAGMDAARQGMFQSLQGTSPEQRAFMAMMMNKNMGQTQAAASATAVTDSAVTQPVILTQTSDFMDILGYKCQRIKFTQGGKKLLEAWITDKIGPQNYLSAFIENFDIFDVNLVAELRKISGFPIQMKYRIQKGSLKDTIQSTNVTKIEPRSLMPMDFEVPAGYRLEGGAGSSAAPAKEEGF